MLLNSFPLQSQPCYWRNVKSVRKRSVDEYGIEADEKERNSTLSENLQLFQALRVLQEDEEPESTRAEFGEKDNVCVKSGTFTAMIGMYLTYSYFVPVLVL